MFLEFVNATTEMKGSILVQILISFHLNAPSPYSFLIIILHYNIDLPKIQRCFHPQPSSAIHSRRAFLISLFRCSSLCFKDAILEAFPISVTTFQKIQKGMVGERGFKGLLCIWKHTVQCFGSWPLTIPRKIDSYNFCLHIFLFSCVF